MIIRKFIFIVLLINIMVLAYNQEDVVPVIEKVTAYDNNQFVTISWTYEEPENVVGYGIFRRIWDNDDFNYGDTIQVGEVRDPNQFIYTDTNTTIGNLDIRTSNYTYLVSAIISKDGEEKHTPLRNGHTTMYQYDVKYDSCYYANTLSWSPYKINDEIKAEYYEIYYSERGLSQFVKIDQISGDNTSYIHEGVNVDMEYEYYISVNLGEEIGYSQSNTRKVFTSTPDLPKDFEIENVEATSDEYLKVELTTDTLAKLAMYELHKSYAESGPFESVFSFAPVDSLTFIDTTSNIRELVYYKIVSFNHCGIKSTDSEVKSYIPPIYSIQSISTNEDNNIQLTFFTDTTNLLTYIVLSGDDPEGPFDSVYSFQPEDLHTIWVDTSATGGELKYYKLIAEHDPGNTSAKPKNNIVLQSEFNNDDISTIHISWAGSSNSNVLNYKIYKITDNGLPEEIFTSVDSLQNYYYSLNNGLDNNVDNPEICFYVVYEQEDEIGNKSIITSNKTCNDLSMIEQLPTAINPVSHIEINRKFNPIVGQVESFFLIIYDRWGNEIFNTQTQGEGWDGRGKNGNLVMQGAYVYYLQYSSDGKQQKRTGTISVIYP